MKQEEFFYKFKEKPKSLFGKLKAFLFRHYFHEEIEIFTSSAELPGFAEGYRQGFEDAIKTKNAQQNSLGSLLTENLKIDVSKVWARKQSVEDNPLLPPKLL